MDHFNSNVYQYANVEGLMED